MLTASSIIQRSYYEEGGGNSINISILHECAQSISFRRTRLITF